MRVTPSMSSSSRREAAHHSPGGHPALPNRALELACPAPIAAGCQPSWLYHVDEQGVYHTTIVAMNPGQLVVGMPCHPSQIGIQESQSSPDSCSLSTSAPALIRHHSTSTRARVSVSASGISRMAVAPTPGTLLRPAWSPCSPESLATKTVEEMQSAAGCPTSPPHAATLAAPKRHNEEVNGSTSGDAELSPHESRSKRVKVDSTQQRQTYCGAGESKARREHRRRQEILRQGLSSHMKKFAGRYTQGAPLSPRSCLWHVHAMASFKG